MRITVVPKTPLGNGCQMPVSHIWEKGRQRQTFAISCLNVRRLPASLGEPVEAGGVLHCAPRVSLIQLACRGRGRTPSRRSRVRKTCLKSAPSRSSLFTNAIAGISCFCAVRHTVSNSMRTRVPSGGRGQKDMEDHEGHDDCVRKFTKRNGSDRV